MLKKFIAIFLFLGVGVCLGAQDIHFAHIHASPIHLNPAMTGLFEDGSYRFIANARNQWQSVTNGYKTVAGSLDGKLFYLDGDSFLGAGLQLTRDQAGDLNFTKSSGSFLISGVRSLDRRDAHYVAFGIQNTLQTYRIDYSNLEGFDVEPLILQGAPNSLHFWDITAGLSWYYNFRDKGTVYLGGALHHINRPNTSFLQRTNLADPADASQNMPEELYRKWVLHGGGYWRVGRSFALMPSFIYFDQGPHREINFGSYVQFIDDKPYRHSTDQSFFFGVWSRMDKLPIINKVGWDALICSLRFDHHKTTYTVSVDINVSGLRRASYGRGGVEVSIIHIFGSDEAGRKIYKVKCPNM